MNQQNIFIDSKYPVALTGKVYCFVDATYGQIKTGDLD